MTDIHIKLGGAGGGNLVDDMSPQLGGNLDVNSFSIISVSSGDIPITPDTTGDVILDGLKWPQNDGTIGQILKTDGSAQLSWTSDVGVTDHTLLSNIGTNTHAQIDTHIADGTLHFTEESIDHTAITNIGTNSHATIDTHISATAAHGVAGTIADLADITYETLDSNGDVGTSPGTLSIGNHTHTGVYEPADATILKDADIGGSVQAYDADIVTVKNNFAASGAPTVNDDSGAGYAVASYWIDTTGDKAYVCSDAGVGAAVWTETTQSGGAGNNWLTANNGSDFSTAPTGTGSNSIILGDSAVAGTSTNAIVIGSTATATSDGNIAIGLDSVSDGSVTLAIGRLADAGGNQSTAIGYNTKAAGTLGTAVGVQASAGGTRSVCVGDTTTTTSAGAIVVGSDSSSSADNAISLGRFVTNSVADSFRVGYLTTNILHLKDTGTLTLEGAKAQFVQPNYATASLPVGVTGGTVYDSDTNELKVYTGSSWDSIGGGEANTNWLHANNGSDFSNAPTGTGSNSIALGDNSDTGDSTQCVAIGTTATIGNSATGSVSIGNSSLISASVLSGLSLLGSVSVSYGISIGASSSSSRINGIAIGRAATSNTADNGIAIGYNAAATSSDLQIKVNDASTLDMSSAGVVSSTGSAAQFVLPTYTAATLPTGVEGGIIYVSDGDAGSKTAAVYDGTNWKVVALGATVASS